jgi:nicotinamide riboside kinase
MAKKIAIIGSHYVGKTSLCKKLSVYLSKKGFNVGFVGEVVRDCPFPVNETTTLKAQDWIFEHQKQREKELSEEHDILLLDRGVIDNYAYWMRIAQKLKLDDTAIEDREKEVFDHSTTYDIVFFLEPFDSKDIEADEFRSINSTWRKEMHERISKILNKFRSQSDVPVIYLKGTEQQVFDQASDCIEKSALQF